MKNERLDGLIVLLLGAVAFLAIGTAWKRVSSIEMGDFKVVYYGARCLLDHGDPYLESDVLRVYRAEGRESSTEPVLDTEVKTRFFYPPTAFIITLPFALGVRCCKVRLDGPLGRQLDPRRHSDLGCGCRCRSVGIWHLARFPAGK